jgi:hypothetical protein
MIMGMASNPLSGGAVDSIALLFREFLGAFDEGAAKAFCARLFRLAPALLARPAAA